LTIRSLTEDLIGDDILLLGTTWTNGLIPKSGVTK